jgi:hypothetical protein
MVRVVAVHGIGQEFLGPHTLLARAWSDPLNDGLEHAGASPLRDGELACAFYGDLYRPSGYKSDQIPPYEAVDVEDGLERELLLAWWQHAAGTDPDVPAPTGTEKGGRTPRIVQEALDGLCRSRYFGKYTPKLLIFGLKQVARYFTDPDLRAAIQARVAARIGPDTRLVVAHSLGSVVAYEALCANPAWPVRTLVTLGSPLGIRNLIFDRLDPTPIHDQGVWPAGIQRWSNVADRGDVVALVKQLQPLFGDPLQDVPIHNGASAHDLIPYLTARETGHAVAAGLAA